MLSQHQVIISWWSLERAGAASQSLAGCELDITSAIEELIRSNDGALETERETALYSAYGICRSVLCQGSRCYKGLSYQSSDTCKLYEIKASVIRDMLNTIEANRLGNNYIPGFTTDDANDLLSTLCTD